MLNTSFSLHPSYTSYWVPYQPMDLWESGNDSFAKQSHSVSNGIINGPSARDRYHKFGITSEINP